MSAGGEEGWPAYDEAITQAEQELAAVQAAAQELYTRYQELQRRIIQLQRFIALGRVLNREEASTTLGPRHTTGGAGGHRSGWRQGILDMLWETQRTMSVGEFAAAMSQLDGSPADVRVITGRLSTLVPDFRNNSRVHLWFF
jgi:hypothetical protein